MLTDTHCHLDYTKFDEDRDAVLQRALDAGVERIMIPALDYESSLAAIKLSASHPNIFAAVGFHPTDLDKWNESSIENLRSLILDSGSSSYSQGTLRKPQELAPALQNKILAIGEIGLDYYCFAPVPRAMSTSTRSSTRTRQRRHSISRRPCAPAREPGVAKRARGPRPRASRGSWPAAALTG